MPTVTKDFTVPERGIGKPDYFTPVKTEIDPIHQTAWYYTLIGIIPPGLIEIHNLYLVPQGKKLILGFLSVAFSHDAIYTATFTVDGVERYPNYVPFSTAWSLGEAGWVFNAGEWMGGRFYNPLDIPVTVRAVPSGYLYDTE